MKTLIVMTFVVALAQTASAQQAKGAGGLGSFSAGKKGGVASAKDLNRASMLAGQAGARLGNGSKKGSSSKGWAQGGSGWAQGGSGSAKKAGGAR